MRARERALYVEVASSGQPMTPDGVSENDAREWLSGMVGWLSTMESACRAGLNEALAVVTHWNKTGEGSGAKRFTGVGPGAWGRVLGSAAVERRAVDPDGASNVLLRWEFTGSEIADAAFRTRRRVWADDPNDLGSPLHYAVEVPEQEIERGDVRLSVSQRRTLGILPAEPPA